MERLTESSRIGAFKLIQSNALIKFYSIEEVNSENRWNGSLLHYKLFDDLMKFMGQIGFYVSKDKEIEKNYKCLSKDYRCGRYAGLEFKAHRYPSGFELQFFQNENFENSHGGYYDFDKYNKMPYLLKKQFELATNKIRSFLLGMNVLEETVDNPKNAEEKIKLSYVESWHKPFKSMNFELCSLDGTNDEPEYNSRDRDKKIIKNGDIKYFRDSSGYLCRGKCYHNMNNMWWVIIHVGVSGVRNIASNRLFDLSETDIRKRVTKYNKIPPEIANRKKELSDSSDKDLIKELKRRGIKVKG